MGHDAETARRSANAAGIVALALLSGALATLAPAGVATPAGWAFAGVAVTAGAAWLWRPSAGVGTASSWLLLALNSALLAALFYGANEALDLLRPPGRRDLPYATLFGLELWTLLCPLLSVVALAGAVRAAWLARRRSGPRSGRPRGPVTGMARHAARGAAAPFPAPLRAATAASINRPISPAVRRHE